MFCLQIRNLTVDCTNPGIDRINFRFVFGIKSSHLFFKSFFVLIMRDFQNFHPGIIIRLFFPQIKNLVIDVFVCRRKFGYLRRQFAFGGSNLIFQLRNRILVGIVQCYQLLPEIGYCRINLFLQTLLRVFETVNICRMLCPYQLRFSINLCLNSRNVGLMLLFPQFKLMPEIGLFFFQGFNGTSDIDTGTGVFFFQYSHVGSQFFDALF